MQKKRSGRNLKKEQRKYNFHLRILITTLLLHSLYTPSLQTTFGPYTIPSNPTTCSEEPSPYTKSIIDQKHSEHSDFFSYARQTSLEYLQTLDKDKQKSMNWSTLWRVLPVCLLFVIGCIAVLVAIIDLVMRCMGGKMIGGRSYSDKGRMILYIITLVVAALTIIFGFFWFSWALKAKSGMNKSLCAASRAKFRLINGVNSENEVFPGTKGYRVLFGTIKQEVKNLSKVENIQPVLDVKLDEKAQSLETALENFFKTFGGRTVPSCSGSGENIRPDSIKFLTPLINGNIGKESTLIAKTSKDLHTGAGIVKDLMNQGCDKKFSTTMDLLMGKMNGFELGIEQLSERVPNIVEYPENPQTLSTFVWVISIVVLILIVLFLLFLTINYICQNAKGVALVIQGVSTVVLFLVGILTCFMAIKSAFYAHTQMGVCYHSYAGFDDRRRVTELVHGRKKTTEITEEEIMPMLDTCFFKGSAEDVSKSLTYTSQGYFEQVESLIDGFGFESNYLNLSLQEPPSYGDYYNESMKKWKDYSKDDFTSSEAKGPLLQIERVNQILKCTNNEFQVDESKCELRPVSTLQDEEGLNNNTNYCLVISKFNHKSIPLRYGLGEAQCARQATYVYANLKQCVDSHDALLTEMMTEFEKTPLVKIKDLTTNLRGTQENISGVKNILKGSLSFVSSGKKDDIRGLNGMKNCSAVKRFAYDVYGNHCYEFVYPWAKQTIYLLIFGSLLIVLAILAWCTVIRSQGEEELDVSHLNVDTLNFNLRETGKKLGKVVLVNENVLSKREVAQRQKMDNMVEIKDPENKQTPFDYLGGGEEFGGLESKLTKKESELKPKKQRLRLKRPKVESEDSYDKDYEKYEEEVKRQEEEEERRQEQNEMDRLRLAAEKEARQKKYEKMKQKDLEKKQKMIELAKRKKQAAIKKQDAMKKQAALKKQKELMMRENQKARHAMAEKKKQVQKVMQESGSESYSGSQEDDGSYESESDSDSDLD